MKRHRGRPTAYRGIRMRSRTEADFARWLDQVTGTNGVLDVTWDYEPQCFADESGQYLPDFCINHPSLREYIEVKSDAEGEDFDIDAVLQRMSIIWSSEPDAGLTLLFWRYNYSGPTLQVSALGDDREWWSKGAGEPWHLWPGMGQLEALVRKVQAEGSPV